MFELVELKTGRIIERYDYDFDEFIKTKYGGFFSLISRCDELWLCEGWENSRGCRMKKEYAEKHNIPISYVNERMHKKPPV